MAELIWGLIALGIILFVVYVCITALLNAIVLKYLHNDTAVSQDLCDELYIWLSTKSSVTKEEILDFMEAWELHNAK